MDQEKIGRFIQERRKSKNMTQQDLAIKMGVSINAVSKWERGLSFPDVSLYKSLCKELDISIEELINGYQDNSDEAKEKAIMTTINEKNIIKKKSKIITILLSLVFIFIIICMIIINKKNNKLNLVNDSDYLYDYAIEYLKKENLRNNPDTSKKDFNNFYSYHGFGIEEKNNYKYVYMWIFSQDYYVEEKDTLAISGGFSMPFKFIFDDDKVIKVETPKDGNKYVESIKKMFPDVIANQVLNFDNDKNISKLFNDVLTKKNKYYNYLNFDMSKITIDDISYNDLLFSVVIGNRIKCIPVQLNVYKNNKYILYTSYEACKPNQICNDMLKYTESIEGKYDYDIIEIIKHSQDANNMQFTNDQLPKYEIYGGNGRMFITDDDNKYLIEFLKYINVNLNTCAIPNYKD